jgi:hypothetical protein
MPLFRLAGGPWLTAAFLAMTVHSPALAIAPAAAAKIPAAFPSPFGILPAGCADGCTVPDGMTAEEAEGFRGDLQLDETFAALTGSTFPVAALATDGGGYIDYAVVGNFFRFRFDAAYNSPTPDRAEFIYRQYDLTNPLGPERRLDFQDFSPYLELAWNERLSFFVETPFRLVDPEVNPNTSGFSDLMAGFKYALIAAPDEFLTFQLKVYAPTGDADRLLGTGHTSVEPGILYFRRWSDRLSLYGEIRDWIPIGGTQANDRDFAGNVLRYGMGFGYDLLNPYYTGHHQRLMAVTEVVGWTVLGGQVTNPVTFEPEGASGDTIVNAKFGMRYCLNQHSFYAGYGRALTGDVWYQDIMRLEYRLAF